MHDGFTHESNVHGERKRLDLNSKIRWLHEYYYTILQSVSHLERVVKSENLKEHEHGGSKCGNQSQRTLCTNNILVLESSSHALASLVGRSVDS